jgi:predicted amidohydrolase YtcJ
MYKRSFYIVLLLAFIQLIACRSSSSVEPADRILTNAVVYTMDSARTVAEAVVIRDGRIQWVGSAEKAKEYIGDKTEVIDCKGRWVMPGFIEGHGHIHGLGNSLVDLDLMSVHSWEEIVAKVADAAKKAAPGEWIIGRGWHQEKWDHAPQPNYLGYPYHGDLDKVSPNNPVWLTHASGHSSFVNAKALELAGITTATPAPSGGAIVKDQTGKVLGVLEERAQSLVGNAYSVWYDQMPDSVHRDRWQKRFERAEQECLANGITSFQDAGSSWQQVEWMKQLADDHALRIKHWVMVREGNASLRKNKEQFARLSDADGFLTVKAVKVSLDGALGSYGAWLLQPYSDRKGWTGLNTFNIDSLRSIAEFCWDNGLQLCVHAIGDRANRETIDLFAEQIRKDPTRDHRWRVEHAQHVHPDEIPRFKQWSIIASMQSIHCTSDAPFVEKRLGPERAENGAYLWKAFLNAGVVVNNGTDVPVEKIDPFANFYAAVTRKLKDGSTFYPAQKMTRAEALYSYTMANAYAAFQEKTNGSIETGKYADLVVLDTDLLNSNEDSIPKTKVVMTLVNGVVEFERK